MAGDEKRSAKLQRSTAAMIAMTCGAALAAATALLVVYPPSPTSEAFVLLVLGALLASRTVRISDKLHLSASHPTVFAAIALEQPSSALVIACANIAVAALARRKRIRPHQTIFNLATAAVCAASASATYSHLVGSRAFIASSQLVPGLVATIVFYLLNTGLVAGVTRLSAGAPLGRAWREVAFWSAPSFLAGGIIGLFLGRSLDHWGAVGVLVSLPFVFLIYSSYRLYVERGRESDQRLEMMQQMNAELETRVMERTDAYLQINERLEATVAQLSASNRSKGEFLASVSHELRTPLNAIIGFSDLLAGEAIGQLRPPQRKCVANIRGAGKSLLGLINDLLDLSKIEAGKMSLNRRPCTIPAVIDDAVQLVSVLATNRRLELIVDSGPQHDPFEADAARIRQILWNLLSNAIKFTEPGGEVRVTFRDCGADLSIVVSDTGCGMEPEHLRQVFERFYQIDGSHTRAHTGTGLGLALVKRFAELHGGSVHVDSLVGKGSTFEVRMPRIHVEQPELVGVGHGD